MKIAKLNKSEMMDLLNSSNSINDALKKLKVNSNGSGAYKTFRNHCTRLKINLDEYKFKYDYNNKPKGVKRPIEEILVENSNYQNIGRLKIRIVNEGLMDYECDECPIEDEWNGKALSLHLDHINGVNNDHRLENLRMICPNCDSQLSTYKSKNKNSSRRNYYRNKEGTVKVTNMA